MVTKKQLLKRIESLEDELGYVYSVDSDKYGSHQAIKNSYATLQKLSDAVDDINRNLKSKTKK